MSVATWTSRSGSNDKNGSMRFAVRRPAPCALPIRGTGISVPLEQVDVFLIDSSDDTYLGRLCHFNSCPKGRKECLVPGCDTIPFNRLFPDFTPHATLLAPAADAMLYRRGVGRLRSALDLPKTGGDDGRVSPS